MKNVFDVSIPWTLLRTGIASARSGEMIGNPALLRIFALGNRKSLVATGDCRGDDDRLRDRGSTDSEADLLGTRPFPLIMHVYTYEMDTH